MVHGVRRRGGVRGGHLDQSRPDGALTIRLHPHHVLPRSRRREAAPDATPAAAAEAHRYRHDAPLGAAAVHPLLRQRGVDRRGRHRAAHAAHRGTRGFRRRVHAHRGDGVRPGGGRGSLQPLFRQDDQRHHQRHLHAV